MSAMALAPMASFRVPSLPWANAADDELRYQRIARRIVSAVLLAGLALPFVPLRQPERVESQPLPAPMARLLLERPVAPPAPLPKPELAPEATQGKTAPRAERPKDVRGTELPAPEARKPVEDKPPGEPALEKARRKASGVGLLAMKGELAEMTGAPLAVQIKQDIATGPGVGSGIGPGVGAGTEQGLPVRALITSNATKGSGGINTAPYSRDAGGGGLAGRSSTLVQGVAGGGGGGGPGGGARAAGDAGAQRGGVLQRSASGKASRSIEEIKLVFERNKGAIYALYNRALRDDPALQGKVVLELRIAPSGQVSELRLVSSELKAEELERKLLARIGMFDFGARDVEVMVVTWPVDFLPS